jgi:hypothetical protein
MASLVLAVAGAAAGAALAPAGWTLLGMSGASLGWALGSTAGSLLFAEDAPNVRHEGPRLGDLKAMSSAYGRPIPRVWGTYRVAGNMIWAADIVETQHESTTGGGGKGGGGGSVTTVSYTYAQSMAVAICEGEIAGIRKVWANGKLIYNVADDADIDTMVASSDNLTMTVYTGSESQTADAIIQAAVGATDCPAYRGTVYVVIDAMPLEDYGNRTPNLEFEVVVGGTIDTVAAYPNSLSALSGTAYAVTYGGGRFVARGEASSPTNWRGISTDGTTWSTAAISIGGFTGRPACMQTINGVYACGVEYINGIETSTDGHVWTSIGAGTSVLGMCIDGRRLYAITYNTSRLYQTDDGSSWSYTTVPSGNWNSVAAGNDIVVLGQYTGADSAARIAGVWETVSIGLTAPVYVAYGDGLFLAVGTNGVATSSNGRDWTTTASPTFTPKQLAFGSGWFAAIGTGGGSQKALLTRDGSEVVSYTFAASVGSVQDLCYGPGYFMACGSVSGKAGLIQFVAAPVTTASALPTLDDVVTDICDTVGIPAGDIDVTDLTGDDVTGYAVTRGTARGHLQPLLQAFFVDAVESSGQIKFVKRGGAAVATIDEDELAAHPAGSDMPDTLGFDRAQDLELPIALSVTAPNPNQAYQSTTQTARRLTGSGVNEQGITTALAMAPNKARQVANVLLYDAWAGRTRLTLATGWKWAHLEPTDVVTLTAGGRSYTARLTGDDQDGGITQRSAVLEDADIYTQSVTGGTSVATDDTLARVPTTQLNLLDIPLLRDQDDGIGFYAAAAGYTSGWRGAQLFNSNDDGVTWAAHGSAFLSQATTGVALSALGSFTQNLFDESGTVSVMLYNGTLASDTEANVLNGANAALLGNEIIQFKTATLTATNTYTLSGLLRGRRGTEWAAASHAIGDRFVLLTSATLALIEADSAEYDLERHYKAASFGSFLDDAVEIAFTHTAVAQTPYAPVLLGGGRDASGNITINWTRRTRIGGAWNSYADASLGEASEAYEVEIYTNGSYATVKRTITGISSATTTYSAANQTTDFGGTQSTIYVRVYQVSASVGRGYALQGSI